MHRKLMAVLVAVTALSIVVAGPALGASKKKKPKTYTVSLSFKAGSPTGTTINAKIFGAPLGHCTMLGQLVIPDTKQVWTCAAGTIKLTGVGTTGANNDAAGTWKITSGTKTYAHIKGSGTFTGQFSTGKFVYKGKMTF